MKLDSMDYKTAKLYTQRDSGRMERCRKEGRRMGLFIRSCPWGM
jgi:hypothetical protein